MEFSSIFNIWVFLPVSIFVYYLVFYFTDGDTNHKYTNLIILILSFFFYLFGASFSDLLFILVINVLTYSFGILIEKNNSKLLLVFGIMINILFLSFFKYFNMFIKLVEICKTFSDLSIRDFIYSLCLFKGTGEINVIRVLMPLAISFIVFQNISYLVDVYRKEISAEKNVINILIYNLAFFKMAQGPIMKYKTIHDDLNNRTHSLHGFVYGVERMSYGLAKKILIANTLATITNEIWNTDPIILGSSVLWLGAILYALEIYYDFSGYSDMAIGIASMFGFNVIENF